MQELRWRLPSRISTSDRRLRSPVTNQQKMVSQWTLMAFNIFMVILWDFMGFTEVSWARLVNLTPWIRLGLCIEGVRCLKPNEHTQITGGEPRVIRSSIDEPQTSHVLVGSGNKTYTQQFKWKWTKQGLYPIEQSLEQSLGPHVSAMRTVFPLGFSHIFLSFT